MKIFQKYANYYDILYQDKDYKKECDFLEKIFEKYSKKRINSILDLGCGTGSHSLILAKRDYEVSGVDLSSQMINRARNKARDNKIKVNFIKGDIRKIDLEKEFDAVISMFAVISYQITNENILSVFQVANIHLTRGGLFIFDCWFGPAVLVQKPQGRFKILDRKSEKVIRFVTPVLDILNHTVDVQYKIIKISKNKILDEVEETHQMRFLFPQEIKHYLKRPALKFWKFVHLEN